MKSANPQESTIKKGVWKLLQVFENSVVSFYQLKVALVRELSHLYELERVCEEDYESVHFAYVEFCVFVKKIFGKEGFEEIHRNCVEIYNEKYCPSESEWNERLQEARGL